MKARDYLVLDEATVTQAVLPSFSRCILRSTLLCSTFCALWLLSVSMLFAQEAQEEAPVPAAEEPAGERYDWETEGAAKDTEPAQDAQTGITPEAYDKVVRDNMKLRQGNEELRKASEETRKVNEDLAEKIKALESNPAPSGETVVPVETKAATTGSGAALATTLEENLVLREQNRTLEAELAKLRGDVSRLQTQGKAGENVTAVSPQSDLFKRLQQENADLRKELQAEKQAVQLTGDEGRKAIETSEDIQKKLQHFEEENALLKKAVLALDSKLQEAGDVKGKLTAARKELEQKDKLIKQKDAMIAQQTAASDRMGRAAKEADALAKERIDLLFNQGVLCTKTGMYSDAVKAFKKVLDAQPAAADVHFNLGVIYDKNLPDREKAAYHYRKFLELDPLNTSADKVKLWLVALETSE